jgi:hypothetical protein
LACAEYARWASIATDVVKLRVPNARLAELLAQHKSLAEKAEFYPKGVPLDLRREIEANDASLLAVRDVFRNLELEIAGVVDKFDDERTHLRKLWGGAPPGTIGVFVPRSATTSSSLAPAPQNRI